MDITPLQYFYKGFRITGPVGNNVFGFEHRQDSFLDVAPLINGDVSDVVQGERVAFRGVVDGREVVAPGSRSFVHIPGLPDIFIFDNHNHAFFFWVAALAQGIFPQGLPLVHVDQHKDTREPKEWFVREQEIGRGAEYLSKAFHYTNHILNVGNFIPPALKAGFFSEVVHVESEESFRQEISGPFVLDIDLDVFDPLLDHVSPKLKVERIRTWLGQASFVTIATSPFFVEQSIAGKVLRDLL